MHTCVALSSGKRVHPSSHLVNDEWGIPDKQFKELIIAPKPHEALKKAETFWKKALVDKYQPILDKLYLEYKAEQAAEQAKEDDDDNDADSK